MATLRENPGLKVNFSGAHIRKIPRNPLKGANVRGMFGAHRLPMCQVRGFQLESSGGFGATWDTSSRIKFGKKSSKRFRGVRQGCTRAQRTPSWEIPI